MKSWLDYSYYYNRFDKLTELTYLVISASDNIGSDRIGINTLPRINAITRDNAYETKNEIFVE